MKLVYVITRIAGDELVLRTWGEPPLVGSVATLRGITFKVTRVDLAAGGIATMTCRELRR
jgi:hypothetical protein